MSSDRIVCDHCNGIVLQYYDESYKGRRGKCPNCDTDFPLE